MGMGTLEPVAIKKKNKLDAMCMAAAVEGAISQLAKTDPKVTEIIPPEDPLENLNLSNSDFSPEGKEKIRLLCRKYQDIFARADRLKCTDLIECEINTGNAAPVFCPPHRMTPMMRAKVEEEVERMLKLNVIERTNGPWASSPVIVTKKDGSLRFCTDYRGLNKVTIKDRYPLPRIDVLLDTLGRAKFFSTMDLASGYWQVKMAENSKLKTQFITHLGTF